MTRVDQDPEDRDVTPLQLPNVVDCEDCGCMFDVVYTCPDGVFDLEDMVDAPEMDVTCPECGKVWNRPYEGWLAHSDAG